MSELSSYLLSEVPGRSGTIATGAILRVSIGSPASGILCSACTRRFFVWFFAGFRLLHVYIHALAPFFGHGFLVRLSRV